MPSPTPEIPHPEGESPLQPEPRIPQPPEENRAETAHQLHGLLGSEQRNSAEPAASDTHAPESGVPAPRGSDRQAGHAVHVTREALRGALQDEETHIYNLERALQRQGTGSRIAGFLRHAGGLLGPTDTQRMEQQITDARARMQACRERLALLENIQGTPEERLQKVNALRTTIGLSEVTFQQLETDMQHQREYWRSYRRHHPRGASYRPDPESQQEPPIAPRKRRRRGGGLGGLGTGIR